MENKLSRRKFLLMTGGTGAAFALIPGEQYLHKLIPYVNPPKYPKPGEWAFYTSTCRECPAGCGLMLWHRDGRITKAEGNPYHPVNHGKICIRGQSSLQGQYNSERLTKVLRRSNNEINFTESDWNTAFSNIKNELKSGKKVIVISDTQTGTLADILHGLSISYGNRPPLYYEPFNYEAMRIANKETFGIDAIPRYNLKNSDLIISFGAGFLETWLSPVEYAHDFGEFHSFKDGKIGKFIYVGPSETLTSDNADEFIKVEPGTEELIVLDVINILLEKGFIKSKKLPAELFRLSAVNLYRQASLQIASEIMQSHTPIVLAGSGEDTSQAGINTVKAVNLLNYLLENTDRIDFSQAHSLSNSALKEEIQNAFEQISENHILIIHNTNPAYSSPGALNKLKKAGKIIYIGHTKNETAQIANWILPSHYSLEDWGDYEPWTGTISLIQPSMQPIFDTKSAGDILLELYTEGKPEKSFKEKVRSAWAAKDSVSTQLNRTDENTMLQRKGTIIYHTETQKITFNPNNRRVKKESIQLKENEFLLYTYPSHFFYDGRMINRQWLQEISNPVSNLSWQTWIDINTNTAQKINVKEGDILKISTEQYEFNVIARLSLEISNKTIALEMGQRYQKSPGNKELNAFMFFDPQNYREIPIVKIENTGESGQMVYLNDTKDQHDRELLKTIEFNDLMKGKVKKEDITWPGPKGYNKDSDLYQPHEHKNHRWGMVIDLQKCIGCKACEIACYAENNIPTVGKENCIRGREMSWLKVPPYYTEHNKTSFMPLPCHHCDEAPCEPVCPVFASVHTEEGLNAQIYNRCVGTRYCSNNCPYKVRRFNWSNFKHDYPSNLQLNPEVTVRERGVMEKCTFCIQRIRNKEYKSKIENQKMQDGEIITACQQTCPTNAIVFGDLNDENSMVTKLTNDDRRYQLLHELNTKPAVFYLKKILIDISNG